MALDSASPKSPSTMYGTRPKGFTFRYSGVLTAPPAMSSRTAWWGIASCRRSRRTLYVFPEMGAS
jgi:hypothetical protein